LKINSAAYRLQRFSRNIALDSKEFIERIKEKDGFPFSWE
jgi:hypothetical protein